MNKYIVLVAAASLAARTLHASLISVDFNESGQAFNMSGVEADWVGLGDQWNILSVSNATETNPSWSALIDSAGNATTVGFAITGTVDSWRGAVVAENSTNLLRDYLFPGSATISWTLSGLTPGGTYDMWVYSAYSAWNDVSVTSQSQTAYANGGVNWTNPPRSNGVLLNDLIADGSGVITGTVAAGYEWAGFQVQAIPEPGSLALVLTGLCSAVLFRFRRKK